MEQRHQRAAAREPDRGLAGGVGASDDGDARGAAEAGLGRASRVERAQPFEVRQPLDGKASVLRAGCEENRACGDLVTFLEPDEVASIARLERHGADRVAVRASNLRAWVTARLVSSEPVDPAGNPR